MNSLLTSDFFSFFVGLKPDEISENFLPCRVRICAKIARIENSDYFAEVNMSLLGSFSQ